MIVDIEGIGPVEVPDDATPEELNTFFYGQPDPQVPQGHPQEHIPAPPEQKGIFQTLMDVPMSDLPPPPADFARKSLPVMGAVGGGVGGAAAVPAAPWIGAAIGSGWGGAAGEYLSDPGKYPISPDGAKEISKDFGKYALSDLVTGPFSWMATKAFDPVKKVLIDKYGKLAMEKGLPVPASAVNPESKKAIELADIARSNAPGNQTVMQAHKKLQEGADNMLGEFKSRYGINLDNKGMTDAAFNRWQDYMGGPKQTLNLPDTFNFIQNALKEPYAVNPFWQTQAKSFLSNPTVQGARDLWATLDIANKSTKGLDKTARLDLIKIIETELEQRFGPDAAALLRTARDQSKRTKQAFSLKSVLYGAEKDGGFNPAVFASRYEAKRHSPAFAKNFTKAELEELDDFAGIMGVLGKELNQKVSNISLTDTLSKPNWLNKVFYYIGLPNLAKHVPNPIAAQSMRASKVFKPGSGLYQRMIGETPAMQEIIPGVVNVGGKIMLLKGAEKYLEEK